MSDEVDLIAEEQEENKQSETNTGPVLVGFIGNPDDTLVATTKVLFANKDVKFVTTSENVDTVVQTSCNFIVYCKDLPVMKNGTLDESELLDSIKKIDVSTDASFVIRSTISPETVEKIYSLSLSQDFIEKKLVYFPELSYDITIDKVVHPAGVVVGGEREAVQGFFTFLEFLSNMLHLDGRMVTMLDAVFLKFFISGYYALCQTYVSQVSETMDEFTGSNFSLVRNSFVQMLKKLDLSRFVPPAAKAQHLEDCSVRQAKSYKGEYGNKDILLFSSLSDRIPLLDEVVNQKNIKE